MTRDPLLTRRELLGAGATLAVAAGLGATRTALAAPPADELAKLDATAQARLIRRDEISARELVDAAIARAEALDGRVHSIVTPLFERARQRAAAPLGNGAFAGVPTLIKDLIGIEGVPLRRGSRLLADNVALESDVLVQRIEAAGFIVIGTSATPEFGLLPTTNPLAYGPTRNPWNLEHDPGGSSGGAGAAVAAGIVPLAQGSDGGGSIRVPSSHCGLFGMKPTRGRLPAAPDPRSIELSVRGWLTRSVRDSQAALAELQLLDTKAGPLPSVTDADLGQRRTLRIAFTTESVVGKPVHAECVEAVERGAELCRELGHRVEEVKPTYYRPELADAMLRLWASGAAGLVAHFTKLAGAPPPRESLEPWTWGLADYYGTLPEGAMEDAVAQALAATEEAARFHQQYDVVLTSVMGSPPPRSDALSQHQPFEQIREYVFGQVPYTYVENMTGRPAMSVPLHWSAHGLPVGCHFAGRRGEEALLFELAGQLETAQPWRDRWAPWSAGSGKLG